MYSVRDDSESEAEPDSLDRGSCAGRCGKLTTDDAQPHPSTSSPQRTRSQTNVRCGPLCGIGTRDTSSASVGTTRAWPIFDPSPFVRCVRRVRDPAQNGRSGRGRTHMARANKVEGLVDLTVRGGSSPLGRISKTPCLQGLSCVWGEARAVRSVCTAFSRENDAEPGRAASDTIRTAARRRGHTRSRA